MATFNVQCRDGSQRRIVAQKLARAGDRLLFQERSQRQLVTVCEIDRADVVDVRRTIIELNGTMRRVSEPIPAPLTGENA